MPLLSYQGSQDRNQLRGIDVINLQHPGDKLISRLLSITTKRCRILLGSGIRNNFNRVFSRDRCKPVNLQDR